MANPGTSFIAVSLFEIEPDEPLPFHVAVHYKGRHVIYRKPGEKIDVSIYNRFVFKRISKVYVPEADRAKFDQYQDAKQREDKAIATAVSSGPQKITQELKHVLKDVFTSTDEAALEGNIRSAVEMSSKIVEEVARKPYMRVYDKVATDTGDILAHSSRVSVLSTFLAYQVGFVNPVALEHIASAGLLHDIGKTQLGRGQSHDDPFDQETAEDREAIKQHPIESCNMIRKMSFVPEEVLRIIMEHHEHADGTGYPHGIKSGKMYGLSKVFVIANTFDELVCEHGKAGPEGASKAILTMWNDMRPKFDRLILPKAIKVLAETAGIRPPVQL